MFDCPVNVDMMCKVCNLTSHGCCAVRTVTNLTVANLLRLYLQVQRAKTNNHKEMLTSCKRVAQYCMKHWRQKAMQVS